MSLSEWLLLIPEMTPVHTYVYINWSVENRTVSATSPSSITAVTPFFCSQMTPVCISLSLKPFVERVTPISIVGQYFHPENGELMTLVWWCATFFNNFTALDAWPCTGKLIYTAQFAIVYTPVSVHVHVCACVVCVCLSHDHSFGEQLHTYARLQWVGLEHWRDCSVVSTCLIMYECGYTLDTCTKALYHSS